MDLKKFYYREKGKPVLDQKILNKKYHIKRQHLLIPLIFIIFFIMNRRYFVFGLLTLFSAIFSFYHDKHNRSPIDFKMPLFLGVFVTRHYGFFFLIIFFIISDIIPSLLAGGEMEGASLIFIAWYFIVNSFVLLFPWANIVILGILLVIVETIGSVFIKSFFGFPGVVALASSVFSVVTRIIYFLTLGSVLEIIFRVVI